MPCYEEVKRLVSAISVMREVHDHHGARVASLARDLAAAAGLPPDQVKLVETGAHLHDVGKVLIRRELLNAPRKLTEPELIEMHRHAELGWALVEQAGFDPIVCEIVRHHHERYDGNGYPDRLPHEEIPLAARIVGICDTYEALTSRRTYREAYSPSFAKTYMQSDKGQLFDPELLDLFFSQVIKIKESK